MEEEKYIVYLHVNKINGKIYVGITHYTNPELRWRCGYKNNPHFTAAISKYSWSNFEHIILFKDLPKEVACREEQLLIKRYRKRGKCYNISDGGEATTQTKSIRDKISKALKGKPKSEEHKRKCSILDIHNKYIQEYKSIKEAAKTHLVAALKGRSKTAAGFIWKYKEDNI